MTDDYDDNPRPDVRDPDFDVVASLERELVVPGSLEEGQTATFARWIKEPYGAVMCVTRWPNDEWCTDCVTVHRGSDGSWFEDGSGGAAGPMDPWEKPADGWGGDPMIWSGSSGSTVGDDEDSLGLQVIEGLAAASVASLDVIGPDGVVSDTVEVSPVTNLVVLGLIGRGPHTVVARDANGDVVKDAQGYEVRDVIEGFEMSDPLFDLIATQTSDTAQASDIPVIGSIIERPTGDVLVDRGDGPSMPTDREREFITRLQEIDPRGFRLARRIGRDI